ncbi:hypothetical protein PM082_009966 [Marasmius tenuissimus]|nr:hypothetical protein PM082_009966 [Marasmius tenuissimus]
MSNSTHREELETELCDQCHLTFVQKLHPSPPNTLFREHFNHILNRELEQARLQDDMDAFRAYNDLLQKLDATREQVVALRNKAGINVTRRQHLVSSVRKIPPEIWAEIFAVVCFSGCENIWPSRHRHPSQLYPVKITEHREIVPQTLAHVCAQWRNTVILHPVLWTRVSIDLSLFLQNDDVLLQRRASETFRRVLKRSASMPLDVRVESYVLEDDNSHYQMQGVLGEAFKAAFVHARSLDATLDLFRQVDFVGLTAFPTLCCAMLESHRPLLPYPDSYARDQIGALLTAPNLTSIFIGTTRWLDALGPFPFCNVTAFTCYDVFTKEDLRQIHQACPRLEDLNIRVDWVPDTDTESDALSFPRLRRLTLHYDGWSDVPVLDHILAPSLTHFVQECCTSGPDMIEAFLNFVHRNGCSLRAVSFRIDAIAIIGEARDLWNRVCDVLRVTNAFKITVVTVDVEQSQQVITELGSLMKPFPYESSTSTIRMRMPELDSLSVLIEQASFQREDGPTLVSILQEFACAAGLRNQYCYPPPRDNPFTAASLSIQFPSWEFSTPRAYATYRELCGTTNFDMDQVRQRANEVAGNRLNLRLQVGGQVIISSCLPDSKVDSTTRNLAAT